MANVSELQSQSQSYPQKVFICFRGKEMRHGFLSFLKDELNKNNINHITDKDELRGYFITIVFKRIRESNAALVIITDNFPESRWCLDELVVMKQQMEAGSLVIIPIFYNAGAGTVKAQKGWFGNRLLMTENDARMKVDRSSKKSILDTEDMIWEWRQALVYVGGIMGIHYQHKSAKDFVTDIVFHLKQRLEDMSPRTDHIITEKPSEHREEEISGLTTVLQALKLDRSDLDDLIHSKPSKNDIKGGRTDHLLFLDLNSLNDPDLDHKVIEEGQAGRIVLVLLGSLDCSIKGFGFKSLVLPKNLQQGGVENKPILTDMVANRFEGGESSDNTRNCIDGETCFSFLTCIVELFAMMMSSPSVFISFGEEKLGNIFVSSLKDKLASNNISCVERIEESRFAIVIFSAKYPESEKCLDELVEIKKRMDEGKLDVLPVFFSVKAKSVKLSAWFLRRILKIEHRVRMTVDRDSEKSILDTEARIQGWREAISSISSKSQLSNENRSDVVLFISDVAAEVNKLLNRKRQKPVVKKHLMPSPERIFYTLNSFLQALNYEKSDLKGVTEMPNDVFSLTLKEHTSLLFLNLTCINNRLLSQRIAALKLFKEQTWLETDSFATVSLSRSSSFESDDSSAS